MWFQLTRPADPGQVAQVVALARAAGPSAGRTVVIAVDGPAGSGKTTLAEGAAEELGCPVVHMDHLYPGWDGLADAVPRLVEWVLRPLAGARPARWRRFDWDAGEYAEWHDVPAHRFLVVEGVGCSVGEAARYAAVRVWVEAAYEERMRRGTERDGGLFAANWQRWADQEQSLFTVDHTRERADLVLTTDTPASVDG